MSRYAAMFERLNGEGSFGAFVMLGDPLAPTLDALVEGGADMIEVGIPFSDPVADGPVIQAAARRALEAGVRVADSFRVAALSERTKAATSPPRAAQSTMAEPQITPLAPAAKAARTCSGREMPKPKTGGGAPARASRSIRVASNSPPACVPVIPTRLTQ
jgi:hypothetical protein